jgi:hypothetical protein
MESTNEPVVEPAIDLGHNFTPEELLGPPKYDPIGVLMTFLTSLIVGVVSGIIIMLASYFAI